MISELNDKEILDFLMTSDFEGDYSPDELKYLLFKWRYFYRVLHGQSDRIKDSLEGTIRQKDSLIEENNKSIETLTQQNYHREQLIESLNRRKLTWKERISGKIIPKE